MYKSTPLKWVLYLVLNDWPANKPGITCTPTKLTSLQTVGPWWKWCNSRYFSDVKCWWYNWHVLCAGVACCVHSTPAAIDPNARCAQPLSRLFLTYPFPFTHWAVVQYGWRPPTDPCHAVKWVKLDTCVDWPSGVTPAVYIVMPLRHVEMPAEMLNALQIVHWLWEQKSVQNFYDLYTSIYGIYGLLLEKYIVQILNECLFGVYTAVQNTCRLCGEN